VDGDGQIFGAAVFTTGLVIHALLGGAELATGQPSRLVSGKFWVRVVFVGGLLVSFDQIFLVFTKTICTSSMNEFFPAWISIWKQMVTNMQGMMDGYSKSQSAQSGGVMSLLNMGTAAFFLGITQAGSLILAVIVSLLAVILMLLNGIFGLGTAALVVCFAPICIPFAIHEATEGIALSYIKTWLSYAVLYLPILLIAMKMATAVSLAVFTASNQLMVSPNMQFGDILAQCLVMMLGPLCGLGILISAPMLVKSVLR
jgi:hypothetical protein